MEGKLKKQLPVRTQMVWYLLATVLILVAGGLRALDRGMYNSFLSVWLQLLRHMIHIGLLIGWMISIQSGFYKGRFAGICLQLGACSASGCLSAPQNGCYLRMTAR